MLLSNQSLNPSTRKTVLFMTNFKEFEVQFHATQSALESSVKQFPWHDKWAYAQWLADSYQYAFHSTRILALAAGYMPTNLTQISNRFITHAAEEKGHEKLLQTDIKNLGLNFADLAVTDEMKVYYRSLYYWVSPAGNPVGLIGWVLSLEGLACRMGPWMHEVTKREYGPKASHFLRVHSDADPEHVAKALQITATLSEKDLAIVSESMSLYCAQYARVLEAISSQPLPRQNAA